MRRYRSGSRTRDTPNRSRRRNSRSPSTRLKSRLRVRSRSKSLDLYGKKEIEKAKNALNEKHPCTIRNIPEEQSTSKHRKRRSQSKSRKCGSRSRSKSPVKNSRTRETAILWAKREHILHDIARTDALRPEKRFKDEERNINESEDRNITLRKQTALHDENQDLITKCNNNKGSQLNQNQFEINDKSKTEWDISKPDYKDSVGSNDIYMNKMKNNITSKVRTQIGKLPNAMRVDSCNNLHKTVASKNDTNSNKGKNDNDSLKYVKNVDSKPFGFLQSKTTTKLEDACQRIQPVFLKDLSTSGESEREMSTLKIISKLSR